MIKQAEYIEDYKIKVVFKDGTIKIADFKTFLSQSKHPLINKYLDIDLFKNFRIEHGALAWGDNEFDINPMSIYQGKFDVKAVKIPKTSKNKELI